MSSQNDDWPWDIPKPEPMEGEAICEIDSNPFFEPQGPKQDCETLFKLTKAKYGWVFAIWAYMICKKDEGTLDG